MGTPSKIFTHCPRLGQYLSSAQPTPAQGFQKREVLALRRRLLPVRPFGASCVPARTPVKVLLPVLGLAAQTLGRLLTVWNGALRASCRGCPPEISQTRKSDGGEGLRPADGVGTPRLESLRG